MSSEEQNNEILSEPPESFGEFLKRHREASGKSLDEIARVTRISRRYLEAFENNDENNMPEEAFSRGFLKNYASEVGMDIDDCLQRFERFKRSTMPTQIREARVPKPGSKLELGIQTNSSAMTTYLVVAGSLLLLVIGFFVYQKFQAPTDGDEFVESQERPQSLGEEVRAERPEITPSVVVLEASRDRTLKVRLDEFAEQEVFLKSGETRSFEVYRKIEFRDPEGLQGSESFRGLNFIVNERPLAKPQSAVLPILNQNIISSDGFGRP